MLLILALPPEDVAKVAEITGAQVDAIATCAEDPREELLQQITQIAGDIPWGLWPEETTEEGIKQLAEAKGDFLIFEPAATPAALLQEKEIGKILKIDLFPEGSLAKVIRQMPMDALLVDAVREEGALTVRDLMHCTRLIQLMSKPLVATARRDLRDSELQALWEAGISGIVLQMKWEQIKEMLPSLCQRIKALPPRRRQGGVQLPYLREEESDSLQEI
jgi:hypothetical protein